MNSFKATVLEVNLISAQQLIPKQKKSPNIQTYVVAYIDSKQKLSSRVDKDGNENPTWNDKFIFAIDRLSDFITPTSCIMFEIYQVRRFRKDKRIGVLHVLLEDLMNKSDGRSERLDQKFMAFHVRNPSGIPHGILNIGVVTLHGDSQQTLSRFLGSTTAIDYRKLNGFVKA